MWTRHQRHDKRHNCLIQKRRNGGIIYENSKFSTIRRNKSTIRKAHENPMIKKIYDEFLGEPYGKKAHQLLHTTYTPREKI
ncbi:MAG: iron hydrogenase small subunit [Peptostreptococcaceae bacterium]|nr:iron hydrogenase small subunit [Peptostreptococcaceae bacterium]